MKDSASGRTGRRLTLDDLRVAVRFGSRYLDHPEDIEPLLAEGQRRGGASDAEMAAVRSVLVALRMAWLDRDTLYKIDRYLTAGIGAVDLVLVPIILVLGRPDTPLLVASFALVASLMLVGMSLFVFFVKKQLTVTYYDKVHGWINTLALPAGLTASVALFWHESALVGAVFAALAVIAAIVCVLYYMLPRTAIAHQAIQHAQVAPSSADPDPSEPAA